MVVVRKGQTLMDISRENLGTANRWKEILDANRATLRRPEDLKVGQKLQLPDPSPPTATSTPVAPPLPRQAFTPPAPAPRAVVLPAASAQDTARAGTPTPALAPGTALPAPRAGTLSVPWPQDLSGSAPVVRPVSQTTQAPASNTRSRTYTVQPGDTLSIIAAKTLGDRNQWPTLYQANRAILPNERDLKVGQVLVIPAR
jgi:nucleoid-associated protein YgaU